MNKREARRANYYGILHINNPEEDEGRVVLSFDAISVATYKAVNEIIESSYELTNLMSRQSLGDDGVSLYTRFFKRLEKHFDYFIFDVDPADYGFQLAELEDGGIYEFAITDSVDEAGNSAPIRHLLGPIGNGGPKLFLIPNVSPCGLPIDRMFHFIIRAIYHYCSARYPLSGLNYLNNKTPDAVAVYDVGQANMNAVVDHGGHPILFYDFGKPVELFKHTFPDLPRFIPANFPKNVPVVISHLDFDHWAFVLEGFRPAKWSKKKGTWVSVPNYSLHGLDRSWVLRAPDVIGHKLGGSQVHFVLQLFLNCFGSVSNALYIVPAGSPAIGFSWFTIVEASAMWKVGADYEFKRNNESLALLVGCDERKVLLTGDAEYGSFLSMYKTDLTGVVAPHHGGNITPGSVPFPKSGYPNRLIQSVKAPSYGMPSKLINKESEAKGWRISKTDERRFCRSNPCSDECYQGHQLIPLQSVSVSSLAYLCGSCICV